MDSKKYVASLFAQGDEVLQSIPAILDENDMPQISVPPEVGKALYMIVKISGAKRILEIGALGGYSTIWLGRALSPEGRIDSLEINKKNADVAAQNVERAGLEGQIMYHVGDARDSLRKLEDRGEKYDLFFIDADKENYVHYLEHAVKLANPGALIIADNALLGGRVLEEGSDDPATLAMQQYNRTIAEDDRFEATLLRIGDGVAIARVIGE
ncbi:O-methyltransferase [Mechercharimyces sp. CAU 1602]|uniref:O-methyltransferase n=1 Tax=Mechercharimyces sp. CAU 1602 TaxID=2973933 RepID=UPI0021617860|nr:O-methyltransferase [Mechercharimyces sp. CAU 1602]MCS1350519.1 O-methyltransferase [Mechercharimyces sp. CAU 1602]